jgi:outer membrane lipoprotein-sorting protein
MRMRQKFATVLIGLAPALTGCLSHTRIVPRVQSAPVVLDATLPQLTSQVNASYDAIQSMRADVEIIATTGGPRQGIEKDSVSFSGYIFIRKPLDLRVILLVPLLGSRAMDMVSNGSTWKLYIPTRNRALIGTSAVTTPSKNGLENIRPAVFFDSLLVRGTSPGEIVSLTSDTRTIPAINTKSDPIEEPDYNLQMLQQPTGTEAHTLRIVHISRTDLLPYQQDIFDQSGNVVTRAFYSNYQKFGDTKFPSKIVIKRPLDQYSLTITIGKLVVNQKLDNDQFELKIPDAVPVEDMH